MNDKEFRELEEICEKNHQRVRWAEEYNDMQRPALAFPGRKARELARKRVRLLRTSALASAAICGTGVTFVAIGIVDMNVQAIVTGAVVTLVFLLFGWHCDAKAEEVEGNA